MSEGTSKGTIFEAGKIFGWGSTLYKATSTCEVWAGVMNGDSVEICEFDIECEPEDAIKMIEAVGGDHRYLMIGSDCGIDDGAPDDDDEAEPKA